MLADAYVSDDADYAPEAVALAHEGYERNRFAGLGFPAEKDLTQLDGVEKATLCRFASELSDMAFLSAFGMETLGEFLIAQVCDESVATLTRARKLNKAEQRLFEIENIPCFSELFSRGLLSVAEIPALRQNHHAVRFRAWIREAADAADGADIGRAYLDAVSHRNGALSSISGKITKTLAVSAFSSAAGALIAGPAGAAVGGVMGAALQPAFDVTLDLIDQFVLGRFLEGWSPRNYFDEVVRPNLKVSS